MDLPLGILFALLGVALSLFFFWLFAIAPRMKNRPDLSLLRRYDYAHRGLHGPGVPENSLRAFRLAAEGGFGMELDLQLTKDGHVVVVHDDDVSRMCGVNRRISEMTLAEVSALRLLDTAEKIPLFSEVLAEVDGRTPLIVELKGYGNKTSLCEKSNALLQNYKGAYCIESFDPMIVEWFRINAPQTIRGQLMERFQGGKNGLNGATAFLGRNLFTNFITRPDFEAYNYLHRQNPSLRVARKLFSMQEVSWTVKDLETFRRLKQDGCICIFEGFVPEGVV